MNEQDSISKLLDAVQAGNSAAATDIYARFLERALEIARKKINPKIQACVGASDIVQEAMKSAISLVCQGGLQHNRREDFEAILVFITKRKAATAAKKLLAEQRLRFDVPIEAVAQGPDPEEEALLKESAAIAVEALREITHFLFQQSEGLETKHQAVQGLVRVLGIVQGLDAQEIWTLLKEHFPETEPPAKRTIQLAVKAGREMLRKEYPH